MDEHYRERAKRIFRGYRKVFAVFGSIDVFTILCHDFGYGIADFFAIFSVASFVAFCPGTLAKTPLLRQRPQRVALGLLLVLVSSPLHAAAPLALHILDGLVSGTAAALLWMPNDSDDDRRRAHEGQSAKIRELIARVHVEWGPGSVPAPVPT